MNKNAIDYLQSITAPLTKHGVQILDEEEGEGRVYVVIPNDESEYGVLIGTEGEHANAIRTLMRAWSGTHTDQGNGSMRINVLIPNPRMIRTQYV